jgi:four helix bundle protein
MRGAKSCEELDIYQLAVEIRRLVIRFTSAEPVSRDFKFVQQIRDAARGAPRNIAEGFSRCAPGDFHRFLSYAKASLAETRNHVVDGFESGYLDQKLRDELLALIRRTIAGIDGLMRYLRSSAAKRAYEAMRRRPAKNTKPKKHNNPEP